MPAVRDEKGRFIAAGGAKVSYSLKTGTYARKVKGHFEKQLTEVGLVVSSDIKTSFKHGSKGAHSAPGGIPFVQTKALQNSILFDLIMNVIGKLAVKIGSAIRPRGGQSESYPLMLEYGTRKMSARPWLRPARDRNKGVINRLLTKKI